MSAKALLCAVLVSLLAASAQAQVCDCYQDSTNGFWDGASCATCQPGFLLPQCSAPDNVTAAVLALRTCFPHFCYGAGTCLDGTCTCLGNRAGAKCERCADGWENYPACDVILCANAVNCTGHGTCEPALKGCGALGYDDRVQKCCTFISPGYWFPTEGPPNNWRPAGEEINYLVPKTAQCCGRSYVASASAAVGTATQTVTNDFKARCGNNEYGKLCPAGYSGCWKGYDNGTARASEMAGFRCCLPSETCCDGQCCASVDECKEIPEPAEGWTVVRDNQVVYRGYREYVCSRVNLNVVNAVRIVVLPLLILVALAVVIIQIIMHASEKVINKLLAIVLIFFLIPTVFSPNWPYVFLFVFGAYLNVVVSEAYRRYALVVVAVIMAIFIGGVGLGELLVDNNSAIFPRLASGSTSISTHDQLLQSQTSCAQYYDYFWYQTELRKFDEDTSYQFKMYCDVRWIGTVAFFQALAVTDYFVMLTLMASQAFTVVQH